MYSQALNVLAEPKFSVVQKIGENHKVNCLKNVMLYNYWIPDFSFLECEIPWEVGKSAKNNFRCDPVFHVSHLL